MTRTALRNGLIWMGILTLPIVFVAAIMMVFGPYIGSYQQITNLGLWPYLQLISLVSGLPSVAVISFWAAHNLSPLKFLSAQKILFLITISIWGNVVACVSSVLSIPFEFVRFGSTLAAGVPAVGYMLSTFIFSISAILLLVFARKQLLAQAAGESMADTSIAEVFE